LPASAVSCTAQRCTNVTRWQLCDWDGCQQRWHCGVPSKLHVTSQQQWQLLRFVWHGVNQLSVVGGLLLSNATSCRYNKLTGLAWLCGAASDVLRGWLLRRWLV
jgi:hypothetical protein